MTALGKARLVYLREMLVMVRDRRLLVGVTLTSLVLMPGLFMLLGWMTAADPGTGSIPVVDRSGDPMVADVIARDPGLVAVSERLLGDPETADRYVVVTVSEDTIRITADRTRSRLWAGASELERHLLARRDSVVRQTLALRGIAASVLTPFGVGVTDSSSPDGRGAVLLGALLPYLVIVLLVANSIRALYVAVGEKEKRTLASLLVCNVPRSAIVIGKAFAIMTFALFASALLVVGMIVATNLGGSIGGAEFGEVTFRLSVPQVAKLALNVAGLALLVSSTVMVLGTIARSQREAGIYTSPLLFASIFLAIIAFRNVDYAVIVYATPILGNALSMKDTILGDIDAGRLLLPVASDLLIFCLLIAVAVALYHREAVLFRE